MAIKLAKEGLNQFMGEEAELQKLLSRTGAICRYRDLISIPVPDDEGEDKENSSLGLVLEYAPRTLADLLEQKGSRLQKTLA